MTKSQQATADVFLTALKALAHSALARTELRGSHQRIDHPKRDDERLDPW